MDIVAEAVVLHPIGRDEAARIVTGTPAADDRWHPQYPFVDELGPLRQMMDGGPADPIFTLYQIRDHGTGLAVGGIGFFGPPDGTGTVTIGYGLVRAARRRGFATAATRAMIDLARRHGARAVEASTALDNSASQRVLVKAGLVEIGRDATEIRYRLELCAAG